MSVSGDQQPSLIGMAAAAIDVLLVEDNHGDVVLTMNALRNANSAVRVHLATDGAEAMEFLHREGAPRPDLIVLDLNLPKLDGREVLANIKKDQGLKHIPTVVLTASPKKEDIASCYHLRANCYLAKPRDLDEFEDLVERVFNSWLTNAKLPKDVRARPSD